VSTTRKGAPTAFGILRCQPSVILAGHVFDGLRPAGTYASCSARLFDIGNDRLDIGDAPLDISGGWPDIGDFSLDINSGIVIVGSFSALIRKVSAIKRSASGSN
jgi:hypothetical protein